MIEQAVNQLVQVTPLERVNEKIHEITELVRGHVQDFLAVYGVTLNDVKVLLQFDWTMVGESEALARAVTECRALDELDIGAAEERIRLLREAIGDRRRYMEILA